MTTARWLARLVPALMLACAAATAGEGDTPGASAPSLEHLREAILGRGVPPGLARIEEVAGEGGGVLRRLVFWARTENATQTVVVAVVEVPEGGGAYVRIQSADLARVPDGHARLAEVSAYMLDRNFAITGAQFARDAADGEVVLRADCPCAGGFDEKAFLQAVESVLRGADEEGPRLAALLAEGSGPSE